jgi:tRNA(Ile)-lysidine synthase
MKDLLLIDVRKFLEKRVVPEKPVLLGYSGGPDSKALLYLLLECRRFFSLNLHLAHVDHGWREESQKEADQIEVEARKLGLPLHMQRLKSEDFSLGNLEEQGRNHRLRFFSQLSCELGYQALILGHHADDQAEVVLKRVFEGASLFALKGVSPDSQLAGVRLWRPLLFAQKKQIIDWLSQKNISYFCDPTNSSKQFLRGRMREEMIPALERSFGKEVSSNLCRLAEESQEVKDYFCELNGPILSTLQQRVEGIYLDLNAFLPLPPLQLKYLLKEWMGREGAAFSRQIFDGITAALANRLGGKRFQSGEGAFLIENGIVSFFKRME